MQRMETDGKRYGLGFGLVSSLEPVRVDWDYGLRLDS